MIWHIAKKEIHHNLYSIRFPALLVISSVLFILNGILAVTEPLQEIDKPRQSTVNVTVSRQYDPLQFCARGTSADRITYMDVMIGGKIEPDPRAIGEPSQLPIGDGLGRFALPYADHIDWMFIIKIVFSLFAIIFTFDAISWERERGTLALMCANPVSRSSVLLSKYLGACGTLMIPFIIGVILNMLIILIAGRIAGISHWLRIGLLTLTSIIYISLFVLLGMLVSTAARRSSTSLLVLLSFWVAMVVIIPNIAGIIAERTSNVESEYEISRRQRQIWELGGGQELDKQISSGKITNQEEADRVAKEIFTRMIKIVNDTKSEHQNVLTEKRRSARRIAMASPAAVYQYAAEILADSGFERQQRFIKSIRAYYPVYENYVREKVGEVIPCCGWSFGTNRYIGGKNIMFSSPWPVQYKGDMSDFPYFSEQRYSVIDSLRLSLVNLAILFLWNVLFFLSAHYAFIRRSLR